MFDLNEAIRQWRQRMSAGGLQTPAVLDELESHLRDDLEAQVRSGSAAEPAFQAAVQRIGQPATLDCEFKKVEGCARAWLKDAFLTLAGIPNQYLNTNMNTPSSNFEPRWATYLKATGFLAPALFLWMLAAIFVTPKLKQICLDAGLPGANTLWDLTRMNFVTVDLFRENAFLISVALIASLILLEWRFQGWARYRRAVVGMGTFVVNSLVLVSIFMMILTAVAVAPALLHHHR
jgi:hypothetical protein